MGGLGERVHSCQNDSVAIRQREPSDKVQRDMGPGTMRDKQGLKEARRSLPLSLVLSTHCARGDEGRDVRNHCGPPETLSEEG